MGKQRFLVGVSSLICIRLSEVNILSKIQHYYNMHPENVVYVGIRGKMMKVTEDELVEEKAIAMEICGA